MDRDWNDDRALEGVLDDAPEAFDTDLSDEALDRGLTRSCVTSSARRDQD